MVECSNRFVVGYAWLASAVRKAGAPSTPLSLCARVRRVARRQWGLGAAQRLLT